MGLSTARAMVSFVWVISSAADGQKFLMIKESQQESTVAHLNVILNWFEELKRLVPTP